MHISRELHDRISEAIMETVEEYLGPDDGQPIDDCDLIDRCAFCNTHHGSGVDCPV